MENLFYYGDNLDVMKRHLKDESVDLVYKGYKKETEQELFKL